MQGRLSTIRWVEDDKTNKGFPSVTLCPVLKKERYSQIKSRHVNNPHLVRYPYKNVYSFLGI